MIQRDTIAAIATASGKGGIGIIRLSGPSSHQIGCTLTGISLQPRHAHFCTFSDTDQKKIDQGIALYFPAPNSFTGEDVVELQAHGSNIVLDLILKETLKQGARLAQPGEFSERAFLNDKIDLVQAEAIADIIESSSVSASRSALRSLSGEFSNRINQLVENVTELRVYVEAAIDFPEEEIDFVSDQYISDSLNGLLTKVSTIRQQAKQGAILRDGLSMVIVGKPNAGKSSLLNQMAGEDLAIVNPTAGTTRDVLREIVDIDGIPLKIIDTAGLRKSDDEIEQEGIRRVKNEIEKADIVLYLQDVSDSSIDPKPDISLLLDELAKHQISLPQTSVLILANNKIDLIGKQPKLEALPGYTCVWMSAKQSEGLHLLAKHLRSHYGMTQSNEHLFTARRRHLDILERTEKSLLEGQQQLLTNRAGELLAEDLRQAQDLLGQITGKMIPDDLLGEIFSSFCIGK